MLSGDGPLNHKSHPVLGTLAGRFRVPTSLP